jgi:hypothetical protein
VCQTGLTSCPSGCVNTTNDPANCGGCGVACAAGATCTQGTCVTTSCAQYGQACSTTAPCCINVPCTNSNFQPCAPNQTNCTCFSPIP